MSNTTIADMMSEQFYDLLIMRGFEKNTARYLTENMPNHFIVEYLLSDNFTEDAC